MKGCRKTVYKSVNNRKKSTRQTGRKAVQCVYAFLPDINSVKYKETRVNNNTVYQIIAVRNPAK